FFSGGRRHTRFSRDWSSDVCSSDLGPVHVGVLAANFPARVDDARGFGWRLGARPIDRAGATARAEQLGGDEAVELVGEARREQRSEEHTSELQSRENLVCRLLLEKK